MTAKRFRVIKVDDMYGVSDDLAEYTFAWDKSKLIMDNLCDLLNALHEENQHIKSTIKEAYENERTQIGKNVLKQLIEQIEE